MKNLILDAVDSLEPFVEKLVNLCGSVKTDEDFKKILDGIATLTDASSEIRKAMGDASPKMEELESELLVVLKDMLLALESPDTGAALDALLPGLQANLRRWKTEGIISMRRAVTGISQVAR